MAVCKPGRLEECVLQKKKYIYIHNSNTALSILSIQKELLERIPFLAALQWGCPALSKENELQTLKHWQKQCRITPKHTDQI